VTLPVFPFYLHFMFQCPVLRQIGTILDNLFPFNTWAPITFAVSLQMSVWLVAPVRGRSIDRVH